MIAWVLFERSGVLASALAAVGYSVTTFDIGERAVDGPWTHEVRDLDQPAERLALAMRALDERPALVAGFPPCTDLASSGARWWRSKAAVDPDFQRVAVERARLAQLLGRIAGARWFVENPVGRLSTLWRPACLWTNPCDFGGYLPPSDAGNPLACGKYPGQDAYAKKTGLWTGGGFLLPIMRPVPAQDISLTTVGMCGNRRRDKMIRSLTPRGLALAIAAANPATA